MFYKIPVIFPLLYNISLYLIYFTHSNLYFLIPFPYVAPPLSTLPTGNYKVVLSICESDKILFFLWNSNSYFKNQEWIQYPYGIDFDSTRECISLVVN